MANIADRLRRSLFGGGCLRGGSLMFDRKRREFITLLGGAAAWPLAARAQQGEKVRRIGVIMGFAEDDEVWQAYLASFRQRLQEFGWSEGRNIRFDYRFTGESTERMRVAASEVVAMAPDLIFVSTNPVVSALRDVNRTIPTVFTWVSEPVGSGYVTSLAHPGGNITGFQNYEPALGAKWMGILKEIAPRIRRVAFVHVPEIIPNVAFMRVGEASSAALGITVSGAGVRNVADIEHELTQFAQEPYGGLIITPSPLTATRRSTIIELAERLRLPAIYPFRFYAASGGLMSYGIDQTELVREAASYVDRILRGANPADLSVQLPTKYQLVINIKTATALGLNVPNSMQLLADELIE
jgi:putative tryptophan/tyrosine transport system substrate-binding protein